MVHRRLFVLAAASILLTSCHIDDADRCGDGYDYINGYCMEQDTETDSDTDVPDSGVSGLGVVCTGNEDCEGFEADYCAMDIGATEGQCTVSNCVADPDDCPEDLLCCDFPPDGMTAGMPNLCIPPEEYETYSGMGLCDG